MTKTATSDKFSSQKHFKDRFDTRATKSVVFNTSDREVLHQTNLTHGVHNRTSGVRAGGAGDESAATNTLICDLGDP